MDFETMGPIIYQDIPSSFGLRPMPQVYPMGLYSTMGMGTIKPNLQNDKFEKTHKKAKSNSNFKKAMKILVGIALAAGAVMLGKKGFQKVFPNGFKAGMTNAWGKIKTGCTNLWSKITNVFNKNKSGAQPTP